MASMISKSDLVEKMIAAPFLHDPTKRQYLESFQIIHTTSLGGTTTEMSTSSLMNGLPLNQLFTMRVRA